MAQKEGMLIANDEIHLDTYQRMLDRMKEHGADVEYLKEARTNEKKVRVFRIVYRSNGHRVHGSIVMPRRFSGKLPCIIWNRGGLGADFAIKLSTLYRPIARMAMWGYVVIASQYSGCGGSDGADDAGGPATVNDILNLRRVLEQIPEADTSRIGMYGASRGGMMTYLCLTKAKWIKAAVTLAGLADVARNMRNRADLRKIAKGHGIRSRNDMEARSAVCWPEKFSKKTPILLMHGTADWRVTPLDSIDLSRKLVEEKVPHRLVMFEGDDHGLTEHPEERDRLTRDWFDRFVRDGASLPNLKPHGK
jgi:dipeptidyl aminopeptidase/acylaminoacyl peptidase